MRSGPGRRQRIAYDATPLNAPEPDLDARIGWLLSMSRLHHRDASFQEGGRFAASLSESGYDASRSTISRWEAGLIPVSHEAMTAYERALGIYPGRVSSVAGYLRTERPRSSARAPGARLDPSAPAFAPRFDELVDLAVSGAATAQDWQELGWHFSAVSSAYLPAAVWESLVAQIVSLLPRSVNVAYRQLSTAAMTIATVPRAQDFLVDAISGYMSEPDVQVVANPFVLLDHLPTPRATRLVLDVIAKPQKSVVFYRVGVWLARRKLMRGELTAEEEAELEMLVLRAWRSDASSASDHLAELIADLPTGMRSTLIEAAAKAGMPRLGYVVEHGEDVVAAKAAAFSRTIAVAAREAAPQEPCYLEDRMLARLLRESLFHRDTDRRHHASLLLAASPFAAPVADVLLNRLADSDPHWLRGRLANLVRYVIDDSHRMRLLPLLSDPAEAVSISAAQSLGHLSFSETCDQATRASLKPRWSELERAKMYALGMTASPALGPLSGSGPAPSWQRAAARWWRDIGPAVVR